MPECCLARDLQRIGPNLETAWDFPRWTYRVCRAVLCCGKRRLGSRCRGGWGTDPSQSPRPINSVSLSPRRACHGAPATHRLRQSSEARGVGEKPQSRGKISAVSACWPAACRVRGGGHTVCVRRAVWHACAPLALDAYDTSGGSPSHALAARRLLSVRSSAHRLRTLTPDHRHLSGTSHPYTTRSCSRAPSLPRSGRLLHFPLAAESVESLEAASDATRVGALHTRSVFWLGLGCRSGLSRMRTRRQRT